MKIDVKRYQDQDSLASGGRGRMFCVFSGKKREIQYKIKKELYSLQAKGVFLVR